MTTLEKIRKLERYLAVLSPEEEPVIDKTVDKLLEREIKRLREFQKTLDDQINEFEKKYGMSTDVFLDRFQSGGLGDAVDYIEWASTSEMRTNIESNQRLLEDEIVDEPAH